jgi:hypothetical protein
MIDFIKFMKNRHYLAQAGYCPGFFPRDLAYFLTCLYALIHFQRLEKQGE